MASVAEPDSTWCPYDGHFTSNNNNSKVSLNISKGFIDLSEAVDKNMKVEKEIKYLSDLLTKYFLTCYK